MAVQTSKPFWQSSTIVINLLAIVAVVIGYVLEVDLVQDTEIVALLVAILNIVNRFRAPARIDSITLK